MLYSLLKAQLCNVRHFQVLVIYPEDLLETELPPSLVANEGERATLATFIAREMSGNEAGHRRGRRGRDPSGLMCLLAPAKQTCAIAFHYSRLKCRKTKRQSRRQLGLN